MANLELNFGVDMAGGLFSGKFRPQGLCRAFRGVTVRVSSIMQLLGSPQISNGVGYRLVSKNVGGRFALITYEVLVDVYRDIRIDELLVPESAECHRVARLEVRGSQTARLADLQAQRTRKHGAACP